MDWCNTNRGYNLLYRICMSKYKEHIYLTMLRKRGNYISHHLDKMEEGPLKALRDKPLDSSLREIKSIFGVYQILLLEIVNDLKFSELEEFATGIQKLFKQVIASSLHFVKGLLKSIQKNYQGSREQQPHNDKHLTASEQLVERRIYEFKEKFYFNLQQQAKAEINSQDPEDQALEKLHQEIEIAKEGILNKQNNEGSVSTYLREIIQHFNKSSYGAKLILQNAENQIKHSDDQLKETEEIHNLLERAVLQKQKKMRMIRKTLMTSDISVKKSTINDFAQTDERGPCQCTIGFTKEQKKALKKVSHNKQYTQTSEESEFDHNKTIIQNHELNQELLHTNKRIDTLSTKALELKEVIAQKDEEISYLQSVIERMENQSDRQNQDLKGKEVERAEGQGRGIESFKARREYVGFKRKFAKSSYPENESPRNVENEMETEELLGTVDILPLDSSKQQQTPKPKEDFSFNKYSFIWEIVYDLVIVNKPNLTKQEFVETVESQIAKNNVMMKPMPASKTKASSTPKPKYFKMIDKGQFRPRLQHQYKPRSPPKTATDVRKKILIRNSMNVVKHNQTNIPHKQIRAKSTERFNIKVQQKRENGWVSGVSDQNYFGPGFKMIEGGNQNSETFTEFVRAKSNVIQKKPAKSTTNYIRIKPKTLELQFEQDKYIITLYRRYAEFRVTEPQPCFRIVNQLGLTQIYNRGFITFDEFSLQTSRYIDKHRNCVSRGDGIICSHLVNLANIQ